MAKEDLFQFQLQERYGNGTYFISTILYTYYIMLCTITFLFLPSCVRVRVVHFVTVYHHNPEIVTEYVL